MKNQLIYGFIAAIMIVIIVAASPMSEAIYPATPKHVDTHTFRGYYVQDDMKRYIDSKVAEGYILKAMVLSEDESTAKGLTVMEKY